MKNSLSHAKLFCAQTEAEASEEPQLETKQFTVKEISLAFRDIAERVERFKKKMDCNTPRRAMRKVLASYRKNMEQERGQSFSYLLIYSRKNRTHKRRCNHFSVFYVTQCLFCFTFFLVVFDRQN